MVTLSQQDLQSVVSSLVLYAGVLSLLSAFMALMVRDMLYAVLHQVRFLCVYLAKLRITRGARGVSIYRSFLLLKLMMLSRSTEKTLKLIEKCQ